MRKAAWIFCAALLLQGCALLTSGRHRYSSLSQITPGLDMDEVLRVMGDPNLIRVGKKIPDNKVYTLHEYRLYDNTCVKALSWFLIVPAYPFCPTQTFWLHYVNDKLVFWGQEGDWRGTPKWFGQETQPASEVPHE